ncbi:transposase, partial [Salmonella enterica]|uniref:transposase n=1 Tax=Salmonella enterica TaxID=28901 RepID=UPI001F28E332
NGKTYEFWKRNVVKYRNREFWCRGYYVDTVGKNTAKIQDYIKHQLEEDKMGEQLSIPYPGSLFTGRSYSHASGDPAEDECVEFHGISEG